MSTINAIIFILRYHDNIQMTNIQTKKVYEWGKYVADTFVVTAGNSAGSKQLVQQLCPTCCLPTILNSIKYKINIINK
jgi:hypothetical protein